MDFDNKFNYRQFRLTLTYNWVPNCGTTNVDMKVMKCKNA